jgi:1-deoxy-D-xylulose-5-phosphate synthase
VGLHGCPVVFVLDRAGITGDDGPSHHGILDMALALSIPGMTVFAPSAAEEVDPMLRTALGAARTLDHPLPKTTRMSHDETKSGAASARQLRSGDGSVCLLGVGKMVGACLSAADELAAEGIDATVWDVRVVRPRCRHAGRRHARHRLVVTAEDGVRHGGAGRLPARRHGSPSTVGRPAGARPTRSSASHASTWPRARRTTSSPASASMVPASPRPSVGSAAPSRSEPHPD